MAGWLFQVPASSQDFIGAGVRPFGRSPITPVIPWKFNIDPDFLPSSQRERIQDRLPTQPSFEKGAMIAVKNFGGGLEPSMSFLSMAMNDTLTLNI